MTGFVIPCNFRMMRVMCIGRINQALILRAFEHGADGVLLLECKDDDCRYGPGPTLGHENVVRVRQLLHLLGIRQERLVEKSFGAYERTELVKGIQDFVQHIERVGPIPRGREGA